MRQISRAHPGIKIASRTTDVSVSVSVHASMPTPLKNPILSGQKQIDMYMHPRSRGTDETNAIGCTLLHLQNQQQQQTAISLHSTPPILTRRRRINDNDDDEDTVTKKLNTQSTAEAPFLVSDDDDSDSSHAAIFQEKNLTSPGCIRATSPVIRANRTNRSCAKRPATTRPRRETKKPRRETKKPLNTVSDIPSFRFKINKSSNSTDNFFLDY